MTATVLLIDLSRSGIVLEARGDRLHVEAKPGTITDDLRRLLIEHKAELLAELAKPMNIRAHLHRLADSVGVEGCIVDRLDDGDVKACDGLSDGELTAWLRHWFTCTDCGHAQRAPATHRRGRGHS
jgi:hypothetical protein